MGTPWLYVVCLAVTGCGAAPEADSPRADKQGGTNAGPCVVYYVDSDEISDRGRLVQLEFSFRYGATREGRFQHEDTSMELDAQSQVEASGSQLACARDTDDGGVRYDMVRIDGDQAPPLPGTHSGTAWLKGTRVSRAEG